MKKVMKKAAMKKVMKTAAASKDYIVKTVDGKKVPY